MTKVLKQTQHQKKKNFLTFDALQRGYSFQDGKSNIRQKKVVLIGMSNESLSKKTSFSKLQIQTLKKVISACLDTEL